jgi:hypothetical protein
MEIQIKHYNASKNRPSSIIKLTICDSVFCIVSDITDSTGMIDENLIQSFKGLVQDCEEQNRRVKELNKKLK